MRNNSTVRAHAAAAATGVVDLGAGVVEEGVVSAGVDVQGGVLAEPAERRLQLAGRLGPEVLVELAVLARRPWRASADQSGWASPTGSGRSRARRL